MDDLDAQLSAIVIVGELLEARSEAVRFAASEGLALMACEQRHERLRLAALQTTLTRLSATDTFTQLASRFTLWRVIGRCCGPMAAAQAAPLLRGEMHPAGAAAVHLRELLMYSSDCACRSAGAGSVVGFGVEDGSGGAFPRQKDDDDEEEAKAEAEVVAAAEEEDHEGAASASVTYIARSACEVAPMGAAQIGW